MFTILDTIRQWALAVGGSGLFVIALLDSSVLSFPQVADALVLGQSARHPHYLLYYAGMATLGSLLGCFVVYAAGRKGGEVFLRRRFKAAHVDRGFELYRRYGMLVVLVPALLPPPAPFKIFVLLSGAAGLNPAGHRRSRGPIPSGATIMISPSRVAAVVTLVSTLWCVSLRAGAEDPQVPPPNMAAYYVGLLKRAGQRSTGDKGADTRVQAEHIASLERRWREGTLVGAGPITSGRDLRGILIIMASDLDRARAVAGDDPAVAAGRLTVEVHPWWGPRDIGAGYADTMRANPAAQPPMRTYQLAFLRRGPKWTAEESPAVRAVQEGHMAHIREMGASGKLVAAGPFVDDGTLAGIFVFDATPEEARALADRDPAVQAGRLVLDLHGWMVAEGVLPKGR